MSDQPLEASLQRAERAYIKLSLGFVGGLCIFIALCWGGHRLYLRWQEHQLMRQAHVAFDKNDLRWAALAAQRAFAVAPSSADVCRTLAAIAEKQDNPEAIEWRQRVVTIDQNSRADRLALAESALRFAQPAIAAEALSQIPPAQQNDAGYHAAAAHLALTKNDRTDAEKHLIAAVRLAPNDPQWQLELAEFQLHSKDADQRDEGRTLAKRLKSDPQVRIAAIHVLLNDATRWHSNSTGIELARELDGLPAASFTDHLLALAIFRGLNDPAFTPALTRLESEAVQSLDKAVQLINWMNNQNLALLAIDWSKQLPAEIFDNVAMRFALADSFIQLRDWRALKKLLQGSSWDNSESLRRALQAKAARETGDESGFEKEWGAAVAQAEGDPVRLNILQTIAFQWNWPDKATAVLWMLAQNRSAQRPALRTLYRYYAAQRDTAGLYRTLAQLVAVLPDDAALRNNFAQISLLLNVDTPGALSIARALHESHPHDAAFASTYAFALFRTRDGKAALQVMKQLTPEQLNDPSVATYYGIVLSGTGQAAEASRYFAVAKKAKLLPEEEELVAQAEAAIARD
jgi:predicted Zn-dependent protease